MSDIKNRYKIYTFITLIFGIIYELFSHQVYTPLMYLAFLIPLLGYIILKFVKMDSISIELLNIIVLSLTLGFIINGILYIYGTTNKLSYVYFYIAAVTLLILIIHNMYIKIKTVK